MTNVQACIAEIPELPQNNRDEAIDTGLDRMIASQAISEGIDLVSIDDIFDLYFTDTEVKRIR